MRVYDLKHTFGRRASGLSLEDRHPRWWVVKAANKEINWMLIELEYDAACIIQNIHWQEVNLAGLSEGVLKGLASAAETLKQRRVEVARRKINYLSPGLL